MIGEHVPALSCQFKRPSNASAASSAFEPPSTTAPASNPRAEWSGTASGQRDDSGSCGPASRALQSPGGTVCSRTHHRCW